MSFKQHCARRSLLTIPPTLLFTAFLTVLLAACGGSASTTTSSTAASTPTKATNCLTATTGKIHSISNDTLQITNLQGKNVQATLSSTTTFIQQATLTPAGLKSGMLVSVIVMQNQDKTYSALTISVRASLTSQSGFANGSKLCTGQGRGFGFGGRNGTPRAGNGTPGAGNGTPGASSGQSRQTVSGTVAQVNGSTLTVTDTSGNDFTFSLTSTTRISAEQTVKASDLKSGDAVTITGTANSQGIINASSVSILQTLPNGRFTPTPTTSA